MTFDPAIKSWVDQNQNYWHESAMVFLFSPDKRKILLFKRTIFPFLWTIPAGHVDVNEEPSQSAKRELNEEVQIELAALNYLLTEEIVGDACRRGADAHKVYFYAGVIPKDQPPQMLDEGKNLQWVALNQLSNYDLVFPIKYFLEKHYGLFTTLK